MAPDLVLKVSLSLPSALQLAAMSDVPTHSTHHSLFPLWWCKAAGYSPSSSGLFTGEGWAGGSELGSPLIAPLQSYQRGSASPGELCVGVHIDHPPAVLAGGLLLLEKSGGSLCGGPL